MSDSDSQTPDQKKPQPAAESVAAEAKSPEAAELSASKSPVPTASPTSSATLQSRESKPTPTCPRPPVTSSSAALKTGSNASSASGNTTGKTSGSVSPSGNVSRRSTVPATVRRSAYPAPPVARAAKTSPASPAAASNNANNTKQNEATSSVPTTRNTPTARRVSAVRNTPTTHSASTTPKTSTAKPTENTPTGAATSTGTSAATRQENTDKTASTSERNKETHKATQPASSRRTPTSTAAPNSSPSNSATATTLRPPVPSTADPASRRPAKDTTAVQRKSMLNATPFDKTETNRSTNADSMPKVVTPRIGVTPQVQSSQTQAPGITPAISDKNSDKNTTNTDKATIDRNKTPLPATRMATRRRALRETPTRSARSARSRSANPPAETTIGAASSAGAIDITGATNADDGSARHAKDTATGVISTEEVAAKASSPDPTAGVFGSKPSWRSPNPNQNDRTAPSATTASTTASAASAYATATTTAAATTAAQVDEQTLMAGATVRPEVRSRVGKHWLSAILTLILTPACWWLITDAFQHLQTVAIASLAGNPSSSAAGIGELVGGLVLLALLFYLATLSSLGAIITGAVVTVFGLAFVAAPSFMNDLLAPAMSALQGSSFGNLTVQNLASTAFNGMLLLVGLAYLGLGITVALARRKGRAEEADRAEVAATNPDGLHARWAKKATKAQEERTLRRQQRSSAEFFFDRNDTVAADQKAGSQTQTTNTKTRKPTKANRDEIPPATPTEP